MQFIKRAFIVLSLLIFSITLISCSDDESNPVGNNTDNMNTKITGRVTGSGGYSSAKRLAKANGIEGAVVTVNRIESNGQLKDVSTSSVNTNAEGEFIIETEFEGSEDLVIQAVKGSNEWKAVVSGDFNSGETTSCPPVNEETTVESEVFAEIVSRGESESVNYTDIQFYIDSETAVKASGNNTVILQLATAVEAHTEAEAKARNNSYFNISESEWNEVVEAKAEAQSQLEIRLEQAGENEAEYEAAFEAYFEAMMDAYEEGNISEDEYINLFSISSKAFIISTASLDSETRLALIKNTEKRKAKDRTEIEKERIEENGGSQQSADNIENAGVQLEAKIEASASVGDINNAIAEFHAAVLEELKVTFETHASVIESIEASINSSAGAKTAFEASLSASVTTEQIVEAYINYFNAVNVTVNSLLSGATDTEVKIIANAFLSISM